MALETSGGSNPHFYRGFATGNRAGRNSVSSHFSSLRRISMCRRTSIWLQLHI